MKQSISFKAFEFYTRYIYKTFFKKQVDAIWRHLDLHKKESWEAALQYVYGKFFAETPISCSQNSNETVLPKLKSH